MGTNIQAVLEDIVHHVPAPQGDPKAPCRALIFDSQYDAYRGVVVYFRVMEGTLTLDQRVRMMASGAEFVEFRIPQYGTYSYGSVGSSALLDVRWKTNKTRFHALLDFFFLRILFFIIHQPTPPFSAFLYYTMS